MSENKAPANIATMPMKTLILTQPKAQFLASGGNEEQFNREAGFAIQKFQENPYLAKMDRLSIISSIVNVALTGLTLNPELKLGYLVPRKGRLYFQSSYMGKREILFQAGVVKDIWVNLVHENDPFEYVDGAVKNISHNPDPFASIEQRGDIIGGYWVAELQSGVKMMGTMSRERIEQIKDRSEAVKAKKGSPWDTDPLEMMKKTIINAAFKDLPKTGISENVLKAMESDSQVDNEDLKDWIQQQEAGQEHDLENDSQADDEIIDAEIIEEPDKTTLPQDPDQEPATESVKSEEKKDKKVKTVPKPADSARKPGENEPVGSDPAPPPPPGNGHSSSDELNFKKP